MSKITQKIHSIDGLEHPFGIYITPYIVEGKSPNDLTLIDTCFLAELPKLLSHIQDEGYEVKNVRRLILTHTHPDHVQAANKVKKITGAKIYSHWSEAGFLNNDPPYHGPPTHQIIVDMMSNLGIKLEDVSKKFGSLSRDPVPVDFQLSEGDSIGGLKVIHTPGHTPGHISLFSEEDRAIIGGDFLFKGVLGNEGLFLPREVSIDPVVAGVSARRIAQLKFDKLLLGHQDTPLLDASAPNAVGESANRLIGSESKAKEAQVITAQH